MEFPKKTKKTAKILLFDLDLVSLLECLLILFLFATARSGVHNLSQKSPLGFLSKGGYFRV